MSTPAADLPPVLPPDPTRTVVVRFRLPYLPANEVFLAGSFNEWHPQMFPMIEAEGGGWIKDVALPPGTHEYRFVADGAWMADPGNPRVVPNPFGGLNSVIEVLPPPVARTPSSRRSQPKRTLAP
ncbi:MAG: glycogen-binding domain-containing protein [Verrucomicrobiota bacterium]